MTPLAENQFTSLPATHPGVADLLRHARDWARQKPQSIRPSISEDSQTHRLASLTDQVCHNESAAREFLRLHVRVRSIKEQALTTGYYEPVFPASLSQSASFPTPLLAWPEGVWPNQLTRQEIETGALKAKTQPLAYVKDAWTAFVIHVQGSAALKLNNGNILRIGYAGKNDHPYTSIGKVLVDQGALPLEGLSMAKIKQWLDANPDKAQALLWQNKSYIFFSPKPQLNDGEGPIGGAGYPLLAQACCALDKDQWPYGTLFWHPQFGPLLGLDTGSAIKGPARLDLFCGSGDAAGEQAGSLVNREPLSVLVWA